MAAFPIWKDKIVTLGSDPSLFRIIDSNTSDVIYVGQAWKRPGSASNTIRINDVAADYLYNKVRSLPTIAQATFTSNDLLNTQILVQEWDENADSWEYVAVIDFDWDWSYDYNFNNSNPVRSFPIDGKIDSRQPIFFSIYDKDSITARRRYKNGTTSNVNIFLEDFDSGTGVFLPNSWSNLVQVEIMTATYKVVTSCAKYALYYINPFGGWDSYLIRGEVKESDNLTRHVRKMLYNNVSIENRGEDNYLTEMEKTYVVNSGVLTDMEAERMPYLLNSDFVFLYDFASGHFIPVIITDSVTEYKTIKSEGLRLINYVMTIKVAQDRISR